MASFTGPSSHLIGNRVSSAIARTEKVQEDIQTAGAELQLASAVVTETLSALGSEEDLARAVAHNAQVEKQLQDAGDDLQVVTDLLHSEERDRQRLEQAFADFRNSDGPTLAGARSGEGSASVIEHLRELTRHKVHVDSADQARHDRASPSPSKPV